MFGSLVEDSQMHKVESWTIAEIEIRVLVPVLDIGLRSRGSDD